MTSQSSLPPDSPYSSEGTQRLALQWTKSMWNALLWKQVTWMGVPVQQWPTDLILMQELITRLRPRRIVETGVYLGGTAVFYASLLHLLQIDGRVISIDIGIHPEARRNVGASGLGDFVRLIEGDSKSETVHQQLQVELAGETNVLVCMDSDHSYAHTLGELRAFARYIPVGGYMVMFDTICEALAETPLGNPSWVTDNPLRAVREFVQEDTRFEIDHGCGKYLVTLSPSGFLRRVR